MKIAIIKIKSRGVSVIVALVIVLALLFLHIDIIYWLHPNISKPYKITEENPV